MRSGVSSLPPATAGSRSRSSSSVSSGAKSPRARFAREFAVPASRALAQELKLARGTVSGAYERLAAEGFLVTRHGFGTLVAGKLAMPKLEKDQAVRFERGDRLAPGARAHAGSSARDASRLALDARRAGARCLSLRALGAAQRPFPPSAKRGRSRLWRTSRLPPLARGDRGLCRRGARHHLLTRKRPRRHRHSIGDLYRGARGRRSGRARSSSRIRVTMERGSPCASRICASSRRASMSEGLDIADAPKPRRGGAACGRLPVASISDWRRHVARPPPRAHRMGPRDRRLHHRGRLRQRVSL